MTLEELDAIRVRVSMTPDFEFSRPGNRSAMQWAYHDRRELLAYIEKMLAVIGAADTWLDQDDHGGGEWRDSREAYRAARKGMP